MAKYEMEMSIGWVEREPADELKALLDTYPNGTITIDNGMPTKWRVKPRDEQLVYTLKQLIERTDHWTSSDRAESIYELLEEKGLV